MDKKESVSELVQYLQTLVEVGKHSEVRVFSEIKRCIERIERLIEDN
jgi:hypothetical protein